MDNIVAGKGGERWDMLEEVLSRVESSALALATSVWLTDAWPVEEERDQVTDRIWRVWREMGEDVQDVMRWVDAASREVMVQAQGEGLCGSERWRVHVAASLVWAWQVCRRQGVGMERVSVEVCDGVEVPERFSPQDPRHRAANTVDVIAFEVMGGVGQLEVRRGHESGYWVVRSSVLTGRGNFMNYSGEMCVKFAAQFL